MKKIKIFKDNINQKKCNTYSENYKTLSKEIEDLNK